MFRLSMFSTREALSLRAVLLMGLLALLPGCLKTEDPQPGEDAGTGSDAGIPDGGDSGAPVFTRLPPSSVSVEGGGTLTFQVLAEDPQGSSLRFEWTANVGTLQVVSLSFASEAEWTAPGCLAPGVTASFRVTVTNDLGLSSAFEFSAVGLPVCPTWTPTGSMALGRSRHEAVLLPSGKVLVVGPSAETELYDPETGTWASAASLAMARWDPTATPLPSGKVLVVGGEPGIEEVEVYDPATNTWASASGPNAPRRSGHVATLLRSGKVLVSGGPLPSGPNPTDTAEVYDPATGTWSFTGSLGAARSEHIATLLRSGKVLVTGGFGPYPGGDAPRPILWTAEVYDPETGAWSSINSPSTPRVEHTATLLPSGKVLVTGGYTRYRHGSSPPDYTRYLETAEVYDPETGAWSATGSLATERTDHTATLLASGKVLVTGGRNGTHWLGCLATAEVYDPETGTWASASSLATARCEHSATLLPSGKVLVAGGSGEGGVRRTAELHEEP
ncbi:Kelch repeat-containing protein [Pyxidicoccus xibeiensis]|uniref:Kelch repeat-containing protein n=1 Tax=Pyxidicoccus xibeiensis TaxID=2906759 RepID=UPI0020A7CCC1|nr:kelch motif-containing protein [Pyxidicoccus xibeiensis]MCP3136959.1 hypothetical protein [Pyxidicoccus xibeiensis]